MGRGLKFVAKPVAKTPPTRTDHHMPILLWLVGIPIPLIILILLLR
jgi:hypothetical protein